jgi:hypothetical protein
VDGIINQFILKIKIMKHVNGLYTQRFNRKYKKDGALFRGRYKSILVDENAYLLKLTRYIHRNPIEVKKKGEATQRLPLVELSCLY